MGTQFTDSDELFLEHTLLVNSAEIIAHLVLGLRADDLAAATLLSGDQFAVAGLHGVVDRDFFDWVLEVPGGEGYVASLARRLSRFDWSAVEHDVLKVLYESVISTQTRKALGEYYTPDWLANRIVSQTVTDPLNQRVLIRVLCEISMSHETLGHTTGQLVRKQPLRASVLPAVGLNLPLARLSRPERLTSQNRRCIRDCRPVSSRPVRSFLGASMFLPDGFDPRAFFSCARDF